MHIYISGKVTGNVGYYAQFMEAEQKLIKMGYSPVNPVKNVPLQKSWEYYMRTDIVKLMCCDSIYMLKGWRRSRGARLERFIARKLGYKIIYEH